MRWKKPLFIGAIAIATLVTATWLVLWTLDFNRFKPRIIQAVKETSGLDLALNGHVYVSLGLNPRLLIHDVAIRNATWGSRMDMVTMRRCEVSFALSRLLRGAFEIDQLVLVEPDVLIETDASGALNFLSIARDQHLPGRQREEATRKAQFLPVRAVILDKGRFTYRDGQRDVTYVKSVKRLTIAAPSMTSPIQVTMAGSLNDRPIMLEGNFGTPSDMMGTQQAWPVNLAVSVEGTVARIQGTVGDVTRFNDLSLRIHAEGSSVAKILALAGTPTHLDPGPFAFTAALTDPGSIPALQDMDLRIGTQDTVEIKVHGSIENLSSLQGIRLDVMAFIRDLSYLSRDPVRPRPLTGPLTVTGSLHDSASKILSVHNLRITGGKDAMTGFLDLDWSGQRARTKLRLSSPGLELQNILAFDHGNGTWIRLLQGMGPVDLVLLIAGPFGRASVEKVDLRLGTPEQTEMRVRGRIKDVFAVQGIELSFNAQGNDAAELENFIGKPMPIRGPYTISGYVTDGLDKALVCHDLKLTLGNNEVAGLLELQMAGDNPQLNAALFSQKLDLESAVPVQPENQEVLKALHALGPIRLAVSMLDPGRKPGVSTIDVHMGTRELVEVIIKGGIQDVFSLRGVDLHLAVQGNEFRRLHELFRKPLPLKGSFSFRGRVLDPESGVYRLDELEATLGKNDIRGWVEARVEDPVRIRAEFVSQDIDLNALGPMDGTGAELLRHLKSWSIETRVAPFRERVFVESFHISLKAPDIAKAKLTGAIHDLFRWQGIDLTFSMQGDDPVVLKEITGRSFPFSGPFSLTGRVTNPKVDLYEIRDFNAAFGDNTLDGAFDLNLSTPRPRLAADLSSRNLDLRPLFSKPEQDSDKKAELVKGKKSNTRVFPGNPLPLDHLQAIDAEVKLQAAQILFPRLALDNAAVHMKIDDGHLEILPLRGAIGGGTADGGFTLSRDGATAKAALKFKASQVDLGAMLAELGVPKSIEGILRIEIEAQARGDSIGALMAGLNGKAVFVVADGRIYNKYIDLLGGGLFREVYLLMTPFSQKEPFSELTCHINRFDIKEGLAASKIWVTDTKYTTVRGGGEIDLENEKMDMAFRMSPKKSLGISGLAEIDLNLGDFARSFKVGGSFAQPSVTLDPAGAAATIGKMLGGLALFGPIGLAAGLIDLKLGQDHPCIKAIEDLEKDVGTSEEQNKGIPAERPSAYPTQSQEQQQGP
jgi:uncharacterized protein involved in outer membrane biogenesis